MIRKILLFSALLLVSIGCNRANPRLLPDELSGFWTANALSYKGRFIELSPAFIVIGAGENGAPRVQGIDQVDAEPSGAQTTYTIYSTTVDGIHDRITLQFDPKNGGEIRLKNQDVLWTRHKN